jgi:hypothetical protein
VKLTSPKGSWRFDEPPVQLGGKYATTVIGWVTTPAAPKLPWLSALMLYCAAASIYHNCNAQLDRLTASKSLVTKFAFVVTEPFPLLPTLAAPR